MPKFICLGHYSRTGKDSFANYLIDHMQGSGLKVIKKSLAWKLKQICYELYAWDGMREPEFYETPEGAPYRDIKLPTIGKTPVEIWVAVGTPAIRGCVYDRTWLDYYLKSDHDGADVVICPDVRFSNEWDEFYERDALMAKVVRPGFGPRNTIADMAMIKEPRPWELVIGGTGEMQTLSDWAWLTAKWLRGMAPRPSQIQTERDWNLSKEKITWL